MSKVLHLEIQNFGRSEPTLEGQNQHERIPKVLAGGDRSFAQSHEMGLLIARKDFVGGDDVARAGKSHKRDLTEGGEVAA